MVNHLDQTKLAITGMGAVTPIGVCVPAYWKALTAGKCGIGGLYITETEVEKLISKGPGRVSPFTIPELIPNIAAAHLSMRFGFQGENYCPVSACATANHAIGEAMRAIRHGYQDIVLCGGSENGIIPFSLAGFQNMKALHTGDDPTAASIPFDARRSGFVMGEGAGALVLESLSHAQARGATIYAEVAGYGASGDAYHITSPSPEGDAAAAAILGAIEDAGLTPEDVDYINAHGTSTPLNEKYEAIACAMATREDIIPPTIGYKEPDPDCDLDITPNVAVHAPVRVAISNSLGFGGHNACIVIRKFA